MRVVVRNFRADRTHLADVESTSAGVAFGTSYRRPPYDTRALCGVKVPDGVVMIEGTKLRCPACIAIQRHENAS